MNIFRIKAEYILAPLYIILTTAIIVCSILLIRECYLLHEMLRELDNKLQ